MKKLSVLVSLLLLCVMLFAQEDANYYKNEGNTAYKEKNYEMAYESYAKALELLAQDNIVDTALIYNTGYCAYKSKKYSEAISYFEKSVENKYKKTKPVQYVISCQMKLKDLDKAEEAALKGLELYPDDEKLKGLTGTVYLKKGCPVAGSSLTFLMT